MGMPSISTWIGLIYLMIGTSGSQLKSADFTGTIFDKILSGCQPCSLKLPPFTDMSVPIVRTYCRGLTNSVA
jgi:hypothetical protein